MLMLQMEWPQRANNFASTLIIFTNIARSLYVDRTISSTPTLHLRRDVDRHSFAWDYGHQDDAHRYLSLHRHPGSQRSLDLWRHLARRDGETHRHDIRTWHDHDCERHRAHRVAILYRCRRDSSLFAATRPSGPSA